ncbi:Alpha/Beta hydrolase protein [Dunaliella salina]|uniref:Alpha/Beta hydrolase protein n=1 Tax=Dunaliella salina TaxID=3046 RepID=A0ABQ7GPQ0_DUNSA|nr:Alpha/Beta hydrolase protein [Dunaliella salina]|eukprot:KAF5836583.1 Alpha/Beta hydrolase protein [Dunaliella salina]
MGKGQFSQLLLHTAVPSTCDSRAQSHFLTLSNCFRSLYVLSFQAPVIPELSLRRQDYKLLAVILKPGTSFGPVSPTAMSSMDIELYKHAFEKKGAATAALNYYRALLPLITYAPLPRVWEALRRILRMPVCAAMADNDLALEPSLMDNLEKVAPISETHLFKNCSHWMPFDQPDAVSNLIREFCKKHPLKND